MLSKVFLVLASVVLVQADNIQQYEDFSQINQITPQDYSAYANPEISTFYSQIPTQFLTGNTFPSNAIYSEQMPQYFNPQYLSAKASFDNGLIINQQPQVYSQIINPAELPIQTVPIYRQNIETKQPQVYSQIINAAELPIQASPIYKQNIETPILAKQAPVYTTSLIQSVPQYITTYAAPVQVKAVKAPLVPSYVNPTLIPQVVKEPLPEYPKPQQTLKNIPTKPSSEYLPSSNQATKSNNGQYSSAPSVSRSSFSSPAASYSY